MNILPQEKFTEMSQSFELAKLFAVWMIPTRIIAPMSMAQWCNTQHGCPGATVCVPF